MLSEPFYLFMHTTTATQQIGIQFVLRGMGRAGGLTLTGDAGAKLILNLVEGLALYVCSR